jgi:hypothetical protein
MSTPVISEKGEKIYNFIYDKFTENDISENDLVQIIILGFDLLQLKSISEYKEAHNKTYSGVARHSKNIIQINQFKFVKDND